MHIPRYSPCLKFCCKGIIYHAPVLKIVKPIALLSVSEKTKWLSFQFI